MTCLKFLAQSFVEEFYESDYSSISHSSNISSLISLFSSSTNYEIVVTNGPQPRIVTLRNVLEVTHPERTSVSSIAFNPPSITVDTPIYDVSVKLLDNKVRILPVIENESLIGLVSQNTLLEKMIDCEDLKDITSDEMMVQPPITVEKDFSIGAIRNIMRNNEISHTPIINKEGKLQGIITARDIVLNFIKPSESQTTGERKGETIRIWEKSIQGIFDKTPLSVSRRTSILNVIRKMVSRKKGYCLVVENHKPIGIITPRDIISLLTQFEPKIQLPVIFVGFKEYDVNVVESAKRKIEQVASSVLKFHPDLQEIIVSGRIKSVSGKKRRFEVNARAYMPTNMIAVSAHGWSMRTVFDELNEKLDKQFRQIKRKRLP